MIFRSQLQTADLRHQQPISYKSSRCRRTYATLPTICMRRAAVLSVVGYGIATLIKREARGMDRIELKST